MGNSRKHGSYGKLILVVIVVLTAVVVVGVHMRAADSSEDFEADLLSRYSFHDDENLPGRFRVLLFPNLPDDVDDLEYSIPRRAALCSLEEAAGPEIEMWLDNNVSSSFKRERFSVLPPAGGLQEYLDGLNRAIRSWSNQTDWLCVKYFVGSCDRGVLIKLYLYEKERYIYEYVYECGMDEKIQPVRRRIYDRMRRVP